jgi:transcriptional regulator with XRE-family HTH domain
MAIKPEKCRLARTFAVNVRKRRTRLNLSQEELAERAGVHRTYVGMLERCEKNVTIYNIERISKALNISAAALLTEKEE